MSKHAFSAGEIFATLESHGVDYVAIGGIAANAHGSRRLTLDVDIIPEPATPNYERLAAALDELDAPKPLSIRAFAVSTPVTASTWRERMSSSCRLQPVIST